MVGLLLFLVRLPVSRHVGQPLFPVRRMVGFLGGVPLFLVRLPVRRFRSP